MARLAMVAGVACAVAASLVAQTRVRYITYAEAQPILSSLRQALVPAELRDMQPATAPARWSEWVAASDAAIRGRLAAGDDDSVVNFLLFGTTFTRAPRATERDLLTLPRDAGQWPASIRQRMADLAAAVNSANQTDRIALVRERFKVSRAVSAETYLREALTRASGQSASYAAAVETARRLADPVSAARESITAFRDRGLSSDTSIFDDLAIDQALGALKDNGMLAPGAVRHVAIVGPGLDFTDKHDGYDFYPLQSLQPFAVADSLLRTTLARRGGLQITTLDLSSRINGHLEAAVRRARNGEPYGLVVPRNLELPWTQDLVNYWSRFGDQIGTLRSDVAVPPDLGRVAVRGISVRPDVVTALTIRDLNIVVQQIDALPPNERFDLVIATNILVYYDVFEQELAATNIAGMLRPGGFLLCNTALLLVPPIPLALTGYSDAIYMSVAGVGDSGDRLYWYRRM